MTSAPLYGRPSGTNSLLPTGRDALAQALEETTPRWNVRRLVDAAHDAAIRMDDFSLVGLAARAKDAVVLAATRESVVLYAEILAGAAFRPAPPQYVWQVDEALAAQAHRFVDAFNALFSENLPPPEAARAETYWAACRRNKIEGRCVRLGYDDTIAPPHNYHWAIYPTNDGAPALHEFWSADLWTTQRYRAALRRNGRPPDT